ncbi:unnamed protein product [Blepharisma stoltei]|uniref:Uncharacterized protein n=1 Tax=Blepharisma stoltei TaxID=1481888 RepID=A0AAU9IPE3_9CILI|nr:unnamed protein product [Blepharisma stoltei]
MEFNFINKICRSKMKTITDCDIEAGFEDWMSDEGQLNQKSLANFDNEGSTQSSTSAAIIANLTKGRKKSGRSPGHDTLLLSCFKSHKNPNKPPKKEYLRCQLIRHHKKLNRCIKDINCPDKNMGNFNRYNEEACRLYEILKNIFEKNQNILEVESQTESGPMTDGRSKRNTNEEQAEKSYNTKYIQSYFRNEAVKQSFFYFVELVFSDSNPQILCEKFGFCCCLSQTLQEHSDSCFENWENLKIYVQIKMLEDLKIDAWKPEGFVPKKAAKKLREQSPAIFEFEDETLLQFNADPEETDIGNYKI